MKLSNKPLAMAYVPWQTFENVMEPGCGLKHGTVFEDLIFPFVGSQAACQAKKMPRQNSNSCSYPQQQPLHNSCGCSQQQPSKYSYGRRCGY